MRTPHEINLLKQLSFSQIELLRSCPRKAELQRLSRRPTHNATIDTAFGTALGAGIQTLLVTKDLDLALFSAFKSYDYLDLADIKQKTKKSIWHVAFALKYFYENEYPSLSSDWKILTIDGVAANELSFWINLPDGFSYRGFIDVILQHKTTNEIIVIELKTTGATSVNSAQYQNSDQGTVYGIILDSLAEKIGVIGNLKVVYIVYYTTQGKYVAMEFIKSRQMRAETLLDIRHTIATAAYYLEQEKFPKHGTSCYSYSRECEFFNACHMKNSSLLSLEALPPIDSSSNYNIVLNYEDMIQTQLTKVENGN